MGEEGRHQTENEEEKKKKKKKGKKREEPTRPKTDINHNILVAGLCTRKDIWTFGRTCPF